MTFAAMPSYIPSPSDGVWHLGPFPIRGYALCIIVGIIVAIMLSERRWRARGGAPGVIGELSTWAVPFGLIGGRLYHVHHRLVRLLRQGRQPRCGRSRSGRAASASPARSRWVRSASTSGAGARA